MFMGLEWQEESCMMKLEGLAFGWKVVMELYVMLAYSAQLTSVL